MKRYSQRLLSRQVTKCWLNCLDRPLEGPALHTISRSSSPQTIYASSEKNSARESADTYFARLALLTSSRGTCGRRKVGCVLVSKRKHVLATGYNGVPRGFQHCTERPCLGRLSGPGADLDKCLATHAEQNALLQCRDVEEIDTCYTTASPCILCQIAPQYGLQ